MTPETLTAEQAQRKYEEMRRKAGLGPKRRKPAKPLPGASDQELYPTDQGWVDFRLARQSGRRRPSRATVA